MANIIVQMHAVSNIFAQSLGGASCSALAKLPDVHRLVHTNRIRIIPPQRYREKISHQQIGVARGGSCTVASGSTSRRTYDSMIALDRFLLPDIFGDAAGVSP